MRLNRNVMLLIVWVLSTIHNNQIILKAHLMIQQYRTARLQLIFINKGKDTDIMLTANRRGNNGMIVVNNFLQSSHWHWCSSQVIYLGSLFLQKNILSTCNENNSFFLNNVFPLLTTCIFVKPSNIHSEATFIKRWLSSFHNVFFSTWWESHLCIPKQSYCGKTLVFNTINSKFAHWTCSWTCSLHSQSS